MAQSILIANRQRTRQINTRLLKQIVGALFDELKIAEAELGINLVGAKEMARVNWQFLQHEGSTDVITFDYSEKVAQASRLCKASLTREIRRRDACATLCGELFICLDEAQAQAKSFKTTWQAEVVRYIVHGVLHLLGHDDLKPELRRKMKREENRLVRRLEKRFSLAQLSRSAKISA
jgi:probable rRNA maturation factor